MVSGSRLFSRAKSVATSMNSRAIRPVGPLSLLRSAAAPRGRAGRGS